MGIFVVKFILPLPMSITFFIYAANACTASREIPWEHLVKKSFTGDYLDEATKKNKFLCTMYATEREKKLALATTLEQVIARNNHLSSMFFELKAKEYKLFFKENKMLFNMLNELRLPKSYQHLCSGFYLLLRNSRYVQNLLTFWDKNPQSEDIPPLHELLNDLEIPKTIAKQLILILAKFESGKKETIKQTLAAAESRKIIKQLIRIGEKLQLTKEVLQTLAHAYCTHRDNQWITSSQQERIIKRLEGLTRFFGHTLKTQTTSAPSLTFQGSIPGSINKHHWQCCTPFSPDGQKLVVETCDQSGELQIWNAIDKALTSSIFTCPLSNQAPAFNSNGTYIGYINLITRHIDIHETSTGDKIIWIPLQTQNKKCHVAFDEKNPALLYVQEEATIQCWLITSDGAQIHSTCTHPPKELQKYQPGYIAPFNRYSIHEEILYKTGNKKVIAKLPIQKLTLWQRITQQKQQRIFYNQKTQLLAIEYNNNEPDGRIDLYLIQKKIPVTPLEKFIYIVRKNQSTQPLRHTTSALES